MPVGINRVIATINVEITSGSSPQIALIHPVSTTNGSIFDWNPIGWGSTPSASEQLWLQATVPVDPNGVVGIFSVFTGTGALTADPDITLIGL